MTDNEQYQAELLLPVFQGQGVEPARFYGTLSDLRGLINRQDSFVVDARGVLTLDKKEIRVALDVDCLYRALPKRTSESVDGLFARLCEETGKGKMQGAGLKFTNPWLARPSDGYVCTASLYLSNKDIGDQTAMSQYGFVDVRVCLKSFEEVLKNCGRALLRTKLSGLRRDDESAVETLVRLCGRNLFAYR